MHEASACSLAAIKAAEGQNTFEYDGETWTKTVPFGRLTKARPSRHGL